MLQYAFLKKSLAFRGLHRFLKQNKKMSLKESIPRELINLLCCISMKTNHRHSGEKERSHG